MKPSLLRRLRPELGRKQSDGWELIGEVTHSGSSLERVPGWLLRRVGRTAGRRTRSGAGRQTSYLKGRRYRYKVVFSGGSSADMCVYRRRR